MFMKRILQRILRTFGTILLVSLLLVCATVALAYCPPVQTWLVNEVGQRMEESLGMRVEVEAVRITPFLDLEAEEVRAIDLEGDTLLNMRQLTFDVALAPLFVGRADINGFSLSATELNTKGLIPDVSVVGTVGQLAAEAHGVEWTHELVRLTHAHISDANLYLTLSDTAAPDTATLPIEWVIDVDRASISNTRLHLRLPSDSVGQALAVNAQVNDAQMQGGHFDLGRPLYACRQLQLVDGEAAIGFSDAVSRPTAIPADTLLSLYHIGATVDTLSYDHCGALRCGVSHLAFDESRYDLHVREIAGSVYVDSVRLVVPDLSLHTAYSRINADVALDWASLTPAGGGQLQASLDASLDNADIRSVLDVAVREHMVDASLLRNAYVKPFLASDANVQARLHGNLHHIVVDDYSLSLHSAPHGARLLTSKGRLDISHDFSLYSGRISATVNTANRELHSTLVKTLREADKSLPENELVKPMLNADVTLQTAFRTNLKTISLSDYSLNVRSSHSGKQLLQAKGSLDVSDDYNAFRGHISAHLFGGDVSGRFDTHLGRESYNVSADVRRFPIARFVDGFDVTPFTGHIDAQGKGYNPTVARSHLQAKVKAQQLAVMGYDLSGLLADVSLKGGKVLADIALTNTMGTVGGSVEANLSRGYDATAHLALDDLNMRQLFGLSDTLTLSTVFDVHASASSDFKRMNAKGSLRNNFISSPKRAAELKDLDFAFETSPQRTRADVDAGDLCLAASFAGDLDYISRSAGQFSEVFMRQIDAKAIDQRELRSVMPTADLSLHAGSDNPLHNFLYFKGTDVASVDLELTANATDGINGTAHIGTINVGNLQLDTIYADITHDDDRIRLNTTLHNYRKDNPNRFTASVDGRLEARGFDALLLYKDEQGKTGIDLGLRADTYQGTARFTIYPANPVFAYRSFAINDDNFVSINRQGMIRADVHLVADDGTGFLVYSEPTDETTNDITLSAYNLNLKELCDVMPYMPHMAGTVNGDFHVIEEHGEEGSVVAAGPLPGHSLSAMGTVEAKDFAYEGTPIGDLGAELIYMPKENGEHYADAFVSYNGDEVGECSGVYYDTNGHFKGDVALNDFPLQMVNAFLEGTDFMMSGSVGGDFSASGTLEQPVMNGQLHFNDAHFFSPVYGVDFKMEERPILFANSRLELDDYLLTSGKTDLKVSGNVNMTDLSRIRLDLGMKAQNFELINTVRLPSSLVFGRMTANYDGTVRGTIDDLAVRGQLDILPSTDLTYLLTNSPLTVDDRLSDLVTFMDFNDTTTVELPAELSQVLYDVTLGINISDGAKFHCFLSNNGKSYVDVQGGGNLTLRTTQEGNMSLIGRCTLQNGKMNYELPVIPMKTFDLQQGSYVEFTGNMMNPRLNITATQQTKAVVSDEGKQRNVNFVVGVDITRTLEDMGLAFTIEAPEDLGVQNQLATMSEEDRYKTAVALLATGMYVTENLTTGLKASNALNAFLQNEIQNIAGKALSTFDLSFGMENGTSSAGTTTTDYSFKFSKRFLDDRFSINIGGSLQTGQNAQNSAASFIDNISLEYRLDNSSTRYVRVFYDRDSHDPLEGSMMKTGAGLVLRRKTDRLGELFIFRKKK